MPKRMQMMPRTMPAMAVPEKGCPFFEITAKLTAPTPRIMARGKAQQQRVKRPRIPQAREPVAKLFFGFCWRG